MLFRSNLLLVSRPGQKTSRTYPGLAGLIFVPSPNSQAAHVRYLPFSCTEKVDHSRSYTTLIDAILAKFCENERHKVFFVSAREYYFSVSQRKTTLPVSMQVGSMPSWLDIVKVKGSVVTLNAYEFLGPSPVVSRGRLTWRTLTLMLFEA